MFYTPAEETLSTIIVRLSMEYEGRLHSFATDSMVVSTLRTVGTVAPTPEPSAAGRLADARSASASGIRSR